MANQQALTTAHSMFTSTGYNGTVQDFSELLDPSSSNYDPNAIVAAYSMFTDTGYNGTENDFKTLLGLTEPTPASVIPSGTISAEVKAITDEEESPTESTETEVTYKVDDAFDIMAEITAARLTSKEAKNSDLMASEILGESYVDIDEGTEQVINPSKATKGVPGLSFLGDVAAGTIDEEQDIFQEGSFFPVLDPIVSITDQVSNQDIVKTETVAKEKTRRNTKKGLLKEAKEKLEFINKLLPKENQKEITKEDVAEEAKA